MRILIIILFALLGSTFISLGQSNEFKATFGGLMPDYSYGVIQTKDHGYVTVGSTNSFTGGGFTDIYLIKTDSNGVGLWSRNFDNQDIEVGRSLIELPDSSLLITGYSNIGDSTGYNVDLLKTDKLGNKLWERVYGGINWDFGYCVKQTLDGGFIIAGGTYSYGAGNEDMWLIKTATNGDTLWTRTYGGFLNDEARSVKQTSDGGYLLIGTTQSFGDSLGDVYVVKTDALGDTIWTKTYGGIKEDDGTDIIELPNGEYELCGRTYSYSTSNCKQFLMKISHTGLPIWTQYYGKDSLYNSLEGIAYKHVNEIATVGSYTNFGSTVGYLLLTDSNGYFQSGWAYGCTGVTNTANLYSMALTKDGGFILCGNTDSTQWGFGAPNVFLVKTDTTGYLPPVPFILSVSTINATWQGTIAAYPNPSNQTIHILVTPYSDASIEHPQLQTMDVAGKIIPVTFTMNKLTSNQIELNLSNENLPPGIYSVTITDSSRYLGTLKLVVLPH